MIGVRVGASYYRLDGIDVDDKRIFYRFSPDVGHVHAVTQTTLDHYARIVLASHEHEQKMRGR